MNLNRTDYALERITEGGNSPEETVENLQEIMKELMEEMYLVEDFVRI